MLYRYIYTVSLYKICTRSLIIDTVILYLMDISTENKIKSLFSPRITTLTSDLIGCPAPPFSVTDRTYVPLWPRLAFLNTKVACPSMVNLLGSLLVGFAPKAPSAKVTHVLDPDLKNAISTPNIWAFGNLCVQGSLTTEPGDQYVTLSRGNQILAKTINQKLY